MSLVNRAIEGLHNHSPYIGIGGVATFVVGAALSSVILKVVGVSLAIIALLSYLHQKFFTPPSPLLQLATNIPTPIQQLKPPEKPELEQPATIVPIPDAPDLQVEHTHIDLQVEHTHITDSITSEEQICTLASINGLSIQEIEERARPAKHPRGPNKDMENNGWSFSGFLGMEESFKEVLLSDWKTVHALGWTHKALANHLGAIGAAAEMATVEGRYGNGAYDPEAEITYDYAHTAKTEQNLQVLYGVHRGRQEDIFASSEKERSENGWNRQCLITNIATGASVTWTPGVQKYIQKYGFYEGGGKQNPYRVDPVALVSVLTGTPEDKLREKLNG